MSKPAVRVTANLKDFARAVSETVAKAGQEAVADHGFFSLVLSGGGTPKIFYPELAQSEWRDMVPWEHTEFFWGDERHVPPTHSESNFNVASALLLKKISVRESQVHRVRTEILDPHRIASEYEVEIERFFDLSADEWPCFDLVLLGVGADGHTASLFPGTSVLSEAKHKYASVWVPHLLAYRFTATYPLLNRARNICFTAVGKEKADIVAKVLGEADSVGSVLPAAGIRPVSGKIVWIVDSAAASKLQGSSSPSK